MTGAIEHKSIADELARVLASRAFARATRARSLLRYLVEAHLDAQTQRLKETTIALDVFDRDPATFDGDRDGIVRVSVNRLREHLERFYADEGRDAPLRFEIARGSYAPIIRRTVPSSLPERPRILVLPLANLTGNADLAPLCDGLTDDLIDALAQLISVRVLARTTSFQYRGVAIDIRKIAHEVSADIVFEGSVQEVGERLRLTAQMIVAHDGTHLWSHALESDARNRANLQGQLIDLMHRSVRRGETQPSTAIAPLTAHVDALRAFHRGQFAFRQDTLAQFKAALALFEQAIALDPNFARAYAALAKTWWALGNAGAEPLTAAAHRGLSATTRALELAPNDPFVVAAHGYMSLFVGYDPMAALSFAARAVQLGPNVIEAHLFYAKLNTYLGRFDDARASLAIAVDIDPLSLDPLHGQVATAIAMRDFSRALAINDEIIARAPDSSAAAWNRAHVLRKLGRYDECDECFAQTVAKWPDSARYSALIRSLTRASAGEVESARALRRQALASVPWEEDPMTYATIDALLGDADDVYRAWEHAVAQRDPYVYLSNVADEFDPYRNDARFKAIAQALRLPSNDTANA
jgi:TolB-like protein/Flp pilus assembly protein TadD